MVKHPLQTPTLSQLVAQAQASLTLSQEGVQAGQALNPRQTGTSGPAMVPQALKWRMLLLPQTSQQVLPGNKGRDPEALGLLGVHPPLRGKTP